MSALIPRVVTLEQALAEVERELEHEAADAGSYADDPANWHRVNRERMAALAERLKTNVAARINNRWDGCKIRIAGVSSSSTGGFPGALANWRIAAKKRCQP